MSGRTSKNYSRPLTPGNSRGITPRSASSRGDSVTPRAVTPNFMVPPSPSTPRNKTPRPATPASSRPASRTHSRSNSKPIGKLQQVCYLYSLTLKEFIYDLN